MINVEKVAAVRKYLALEFPGLEIRDHYDMPLGGEEAGEGRFQAMVDTGCQHFVKGGQYQ